MPVKAFFATDYAGVIEALRFNKAQVAWMGNKSAMEAVDRAMSRSSPGRRQDGSEGYSLLVVPGQPLQEPRRRPSKQRASLTLGFVAPAP